MRRIFFTIILFVGLGSAHATEQSKISDALIPRLTVNSDKACNGLLEDAKKKFNTDVDFVETYGDASKSGALLDWEILGGSNLESIEAYGKTYYLGHIRNPGCGGACEAYQSLVSDQPIEDKENTDDGAHDADRPPAASYDYMIATNNEGVPYLIVYGVYGEFKNTLLVYKLDLSAKWKSACEISFAPDVYKLESNTDYVSATSSLTDLNESLLGLSRGGGSCGSLSTLARLQNEVPDRLKMVLYRPWALKPFKSFLGDEWGYERTLAQLETWSLTGISEFNALQAYKTQLGKTVNSISSFYQRVYGYSAKKSDDMALGALQNAVARSFSFGEFNPGFVNGEAELRRAILEKRPMSEIKAIQFDTSKIDSVDVDQYFAEPASYESILNIAIGYPEALDYLISKGTKADKQNGFGKTPLMYAAQYNQLQSAKVLIDAGSNTNAATIKPNNDCYYTIKNINVTPLYYAVRYASPDFIKLLLQNGALPSIKTKDHDYEDKEGDNILFWYDAYNDQHARERNPNIPADKYQEVKSMLEHPEKYTSIQSIDDLISDAESLYKKGKIEQAYQKLSLALQIDSDNEKALSDMSLVALKKDDFGFSLESSARLIKNSKDEKIKASAWFNQGLACEKSGRPYLSYNGKYYCKSGLLGYFLKSLVIDDTEARKNKLMNMFENKLVPYCEIPYKEKIIKINFFYENSSDESPTQMETLSILHDSNLKIEANDFFWGAYTFSIPGDSKSPRKYDVETTLDGSYPLNAEKTLTILKSPRYLQFPFRLGDSVCKDDKSPAVPAQGLK